MVIAVDPDVPLRYVLEEDRSLPKEDQTVFLFKVVTLRDLNRMKAKYANMDPEQGKVDDAKALLTEFVVGWENFKDPNGNQIEFVEGSNDNWDRFRLGNIAELANAVMDSNKIPKETEKNLG